MKKISTNRGFVEIILVAIVVIATLSYFNIDVRNILDTPIIQKIWLILKGAWTGYFIPLGAYLLSSITGLFN